MIKMPRGTKDILPEEVYKWHYVENVINNLCKDFNYKEIRVPVFEHTELFSRGVGDTTDVVQKEMYTFFDKDERSLTLRPEGTAGVMRSFIENGLYGGVLPLKLYYLISCFRYEKPQAGRLREFHQFGIEVLGTMDPSADAEVISVAHMLFKRLGVKGIRLNINSLGCKTCRAEYSKELNEYFNSHIGDLCDTCKDRLKKNPMRIIDCKNEGCKTIAKSAPSILDFICDECSTHFDKTKAHLDSMDIKYNIDPTIVRGLDYYSKTVFEFISDDIGAQSTVCGGGRYDYLAEQIGDVKCAGLGFALGLERLIMLMENQGINFKDDSVCDVFVATLGNNADEFASGYCHKLREAGVAAIRDLNSRSLKAQMKFADKTNARYSIVVGDDELLNNKAVLKDMQTGEKSEIVLSDIESLVKVLKN